MSARRGAALTAASPARISSGPEVGRFEVLGLLGTGAEGVVLLAHDRADASQEPLGLKVARRLGSDPDALARLRDEARILAWLSHENIVQVHRLLEKDGLPIVVMEYVEGVSTLELLGHLREGLPAAVATAVAHRTAIALEAAYEAPGPDGRPMRIVHRDIKPANLLLSVDGQVKVVDFGIATGSFDETCPLGEGEFMGTPGYVAPERREGGADTPAVDAYALGASLYGLLTGRLLVQSMSAQGHDPSVARALDTLAPSGVGETGRVLLRRLLADLVAYDPARRPVSGTLVARLAEVLDAVGHPDLPAYAAAHVAPLLAERRAKQPQQPIGDHLSFLECGDFADAGLATPGPSRELALRPTQAPVDVDPLLANLEVPRRLPWRRSVDTARVVAALVALRGTRDPRAVTRAYELTGHPDAAVSEAAWDLLIAACG